MNADAFCRMLVQHGHFLVGGVSSEHIPSALLIRFGILIPDKDLESALANKPVIIPFFDNFSRTEKGQKYPLKSHLDLFDVARNMEQFRQLILYRLETPYVCDSDTENGIKALFEESVSIVDGSVFGNTERVINEVIDAQKRS